MKRWAAIARFGGIGDNLVAGAPLYALKKMGYMTEVLTSEPNHVVFLNNPHVDKLTIHTPDRDFPQGDLLAWQKYFEGRARTYDVFGHLSHSMEGRHAIFETMTAFWWPEDYRREICAGSYLETAMKIMRVPAPYEFDKLYYPTDEEIERANRTKEELGGKFISWVINGSRIDKVYVQAPILIPRIIKELGVPVVMHGAGEKEYSMAFAIQEQVRVQNSSTWGIVSAISKEGTEPSGHQNWPLRRSLALASVADLVVSPDTGVAWSVAMNDQPKIILVSHTSVENITKHWRNTVTMHADPDRVPCWPCHRLHNTPDTCVPNEFGNGAKCMTDISVEALFQQIKASLNPSSNVLQFKAAS